MNPKNTNHDVEVESKKTTLLDHLNALRKLLTQAAITMLAGFVIAFYFICKPLLNFIIQPIQSRGIEIIYTAVSEAFSTQLRISIVSGIILVSPVLVYLVWRFIRPALYDREIQLFRIMFFLIVILFLIGVVFCYTYVYGLAINFFIISGENLATPMLSIDKYISFLFAFLLPFGVIFEMPVVIYLLTRTGLVNYESLAKSRRFVVFGIFVAAAILTPPDVISQIMLGIPMYVLYEISVQIARITKKKNREQDPASNT